MNKKKKKIIILILILIILILIIFIFKSNKNNIKHDDILFLKLFHNSKQEENQYDFQVKYGKTQSKSVNLLNTTNTKVKEKICPGTYGSFSILLKSTDKLKYAIQFESINEKPKNLRFNAYINGIKIAEGGALEELEDNLKGEVTPTKTIRVIINWLWDYDEIKARYNFPDKDETNSVDNKDTEDEKNSVDNQDTEDGKKIKEYNFKIHATAEEI